MESETALELIRPLSYCTKIQSLTIDLRQIEIYYICQSYLRQKNIQIFPLLFIQQTLQNYCLGFTNFLFINLYIYLEFLFFNQRKLINQFFIFQYARLLDNKKKFISQIIKQLIRSNHISPDRGQDLYKALGNVLARCMNLSTFSLDLSNNYIQKSGAKQLALVLQKGKNLSTLRLKLKSIKFDEDGLYKASELSQALEKCTNLSTLELDFSMNMLHQQIAIDLGSALSKWKNLRILILNLSNNVIFDQGAQKLCSEILKCSKLAKLDLNLNFNRLLPSTRQELKGNIIKMKRLICKNINI
ncbi:kinase domain protein (macronuclear) [Tetrahymena thermophila SB210]|uniref:Kinase domain protein n=1 Tax=Tetrahymena thermophila (strain SB210) TaxID=312017 RepID=A4VER0_TETTS|nr:kinase domain protein [Tetrahymena thermophila SB210]EDK32031.2 kinase domain protein [Tetrahymena thermophila SB210]|eukprot:XP_001471125.2 kinase domain protein [Tetrahymena thermophila SB210]